MLGGDVHDIPDLSRLGIELDDDDDVRPQATGQRRDLIAADLVADIQRRQAATAERSFDSSSGGGRLQGNAFAPDSSLGDHDSSTDVLRLFGGRRDGQGGDRVTANVKALQALQHRSRHPPTTHGAGDVVKSAPFDASLYGSLPPDIGSLDCTVYVQYLPVTMREYEFMDLICAHGEPKRVRICGNPKKEHNWTYGFVEYGSPEEATRFIANCDGIRAGPFRMRCNIAKTPIVDRLAIDAPPDGKCTFAQKFPNRTLRELILASIAVNEEQQQQGGLHQVPPPPSLSISGPGPQVNTPSHAEQVRAAAQAAVQSPLAIPTDFAIPIVAAVKDALSFATDRNQSSFYSAKGSITVVLEHARRRNETVPSTRCTATLLNGTDVVFLCRLLLSVLHVMHGSCDEALNYALAALQSLPTSIDVLNYINKIDPELDTAGAPRGFTPLLLNHLISFGLILEPVSVLAARAFYQAAHHRATVHGMTAHKAIETVLASDLVPFNVAPLHSADSVAQPTSLLRAMFPLVAAQEHGFAGYFTAHVAKTGTLAVTCVNAFSYPIGAGSPEPQLLSSPVPPQHTSDFGGSTSRTNAPW